MAAHGIETNPAEAGPVPKPAELQSSSEATNETLLAWARWACYQNAVQAAQATIPREAQESADAVLKLSQAIVILDPSVVSPGGVPPDALSPARPRIPMDKSAPSAKHNAGG